MENVNSLFIVDKKPNAEHSEQNLEQDLFPLFSSSKFSLLVNDEQEENAEDYFGLPSPNIKIKDALEKCSIKIEHFGKTNTVDESKRMGKFKDKLLSSIDKYLDEIRQSSNQESFITDGIEAKNDISKLGMSDRELNKLNRKEREKTKGSNWFNMKAPEMSEELRNELEIIQMRSALDPKHFYKRSEMKTLPKYFEVGKVVESSVGYHDSKNIRKRNKTLVDELMEDAEFQKFNKKKYKESSALDKSNFKKFKKLNKIKKR